MPVPNYTSYFLDSHLPVRKPAFANKIISVTLADQSSVVLWLRGKIYGLHSLSVQVRPPRIGGVPRPWSENDKSLSALLQARDWPSSPDVSRKYTPDVGSGVVIGMYLHTPIFTYKMDCTISHLSSYASSRRSWDKDNRSVAFGIFIYGLYQYIFSRSVL